MPVSFVCRSLSFVFIAAVALSGAPVLGKEQPARQKIEAMSLKQSSILLGDVETIICPLGVKITGAGGSFKLLSVAPDWRIFLYNDRQKRMFSCPLQDFRSRFNTAAAYLVGADVSFQKLVAGPRSVREGIGLRRYSYAARDPKLVARRDEVHNIDCLAYDGPVAPPAAPQVFARVFGVSPHVKGATFELSVLKGKTSAFRALQTKGVRRIQISRSDLLPPTKYKSSTQAEVMQIGAINVTDVLEGLR